MLTFHRALELDYRRPNSFRILGLTRFGLVRNNACEGERLSGWLSDGNDCRVVTMVPEQMERMLTTVRSMVAELAWAARVRQALRDRRQCIFTTEMAIVTLCAAVQCAADNALSQLRPKAPGKKGAREALTAKKGVFERDKHFSDG